jgi:cystathionine gamma-lyase
MNDDIADSPGRAAVASPQGGAGLWVTRWCRRSPPRPPFTCRMSKAPPRLRPQWQCRPGMRSRPSWRSWKRPRRSPFPSGMAAIGGTFRHAEGRRPAGDPVGRLLRHPRALRRAFWHPWASRSPNCRPATMPSGRFTGAAVVYLETPSNPGLDVVDIAAVAARARAAGAQVIADNTTMTPLLQRPLDLGADLVVAADTKAPAGHSDVLFGHVAGRDAGLMARVRDWRRMAGAVPGPFEAFLVHRGTGDAGGAAGADVRQCRGDRRSAGRARGGPGPALSGAAGRPVAWRRGRADGEWRLPDRLRTGRCGPAEAFLARCPLIEQATSFGGTHTCGRTPGALGRRGGRGLHPPVGGRGAGRGAVAGDGRGAGR